VSSVFRQSLKNTASFTVHLPGPDDKKRGDNFSTIPFPAAGMPVLQFLDRDGLLRAVLHAGLAVDALGHVDRIGLAAIELEHLLGADVDAGAVTVTLVPIDCYHDHAASSSFNK
jgi:hypothetical protein